ncbi:MAG: PAS domain-containing protein [Kordiimonadaceae bacterium]|nr:PAS domain-containing protein [Kordiimonadaceae bacterium]
MLSTQELEPISLEGQAAYECDAPETEETQALFDLWASKSDGSELPCRTSFTPMEMKSYLDRIYIIEPIDEGRDYLIRLTGTALVAMFGVDFTGRKYSDASMKGAQWRLPMYGKVAETQRPVIFRFKLGAIEAPRLMTENIILPVSDKKTGDILLLGLSVIVGTYNGNGDFVEK